MRSRRFAVLLTCWFILVLVQFVAAQWSTPVVLGGAVGVGLLSPIVVRFFKLELGEVGVVLLATGASVAGIAPGALGSPPTSLGLILAPALALAAAGLVVLARWGSYDRCALCPRRLGTGVWFRCPRCGLKVCDHECWDFDNIRCRLCQQNRVPIPNFTDSRWLNDRLGPRVAHGRCQLCLAACSDADLRACPKCGRPQCRDCWDASNGRCSHCRWLVDGLPERLKAYLGP